MSGRAFETLLIASPKNNWKMFYSNLLFAHCMLVQVANTFKKAKRPNLDKWQTRQEHFRKFIFDNELTIDITIYKNRRRKILTKDYFQSNNFQVTIQTSSLY